MAAQTQKAHREAMEELVSFMRDTGLSTYRGPLLGNGWKVDLVEVQLGPAPYRAPEEPKVKPHPAEPPPRGDDGLTEEEQRLVYAASGGR